MTKTMKILLESYEDILWVQEDLAIYYSMLERSLWLSYGQHDIKLCQQFIANQYTVIDKMLKTRQCKALYMTMWINGLTSFLAVCLNSRNHKLKGMI